MDRRKSLNDSQHEEILRKTKAGKSTRDIAKDMNIAASTVSKYINLPPPAIKPIFHDKKEADFNWRDWAGHAVKTQELYKKASSTQTFATVEVPTDEPIVVVPFSDQHIGARGADYAEFIRMTDMIIRTPNLYVILLGDEMEYAIKLRSVAEVCAQLFDPAKQDQFIEQWFDEVWHKVIAASWCNHVQERQEKQAGSSQKKRYFAKQVPFFDGIGHLNLLVGKEVYRIAMSHKFRGYSYQNPCHAGMRYMRYQGTDREIALMGDIHQPAFISYNDGDKERLSLVAGTLNIGSTYAQRYFSIFTQSHYPVIEFDPNEHSFTPWKSIDRWLKVRNGWVAGKQKG